VLITGITGMVGSHLADFLIENTECYIYGMYRWRSSLDNIEHLIPRINNNDRIELLYGDLNDQISLLKVIEIARPDYVFHLAAQSYPRTSFDSTIDTLNTNILGTARLLEAIKESKTKGKIDTTVVHICSSSEVFGRVPKENIPIGEEESFHPASPYAISKAGTDLLGRYYGEAYGLITITTRMFTHTGPRRSDVFAESSFAKQIAMIEQGHIEPIVKVGNLSSLRTFIDVRDAVRAYYMLVTVNPIAGEYYNIGGTHTCTVGEMLSYLLGQSTKKDICIEEDPERIRPIDADLQIPDSRKFIKHTGWKGEVPFEKTMKDLLQYWREKIQKGSYFLQR
jgi:GDP-mannose 4,6-dehydratase